MMGFEEKEVTKTSTGEASLKCLQPKGFPSGNPVEGFTELKGKVNVQSGGDVVEVAHLTSTKSVEPLNEFSNRPAYHHGFGSCAASYQDSQKAQHYHINSSEGQYYPFHMETHAQHYPYRMYSRGYPHEQQFQDFQYFVVIDFEATCDQDRNPHPQEIIEFPSVIVSSATAQLEACFQTYVRPTCNQSLSDFCKDLTGIQQIQVDRGVTLSEALLRHDKWLENKGIKNTSFAVVTWSNWDCRVMLESECRFKNIRKPPYFNRWINLKVPFQEIFGGVRCNLKEAVEMAGLPWQGRAHCGLDDAKNTARLLALFMRRGVRFTITNSLMWQATDQGPRPELQLHMPASRHQQSYSYNPQYHHHHHHPMCFCGVKSSRGMVRKPGPKQGSFFFGCGNWTATRGACCHYFEWASASPMG